MRKQSKTFWLIINFLFVLYLFPQTIYARSLHFIAYGDTRQNIESLEKPQVKHNVMARVIREMDPEFILFSGDMVYYNEFEKFIEVVASNYIGERMIPLYPAIGNHELMYGEKVDSIIKELLKIIGVVEKPKESPSSSINLLNDVEKLKLKLYREIDSIIEGKLKTRSRYVLCEEICGKLNPAYVSYLKEVLCEKNGGQSWYSFIKEVNGLKMKFIALNSSLPGDDNQFDWFLGELKQFNGPKIIFEHYPLYSIGTHGCMDLLDNKSKAARFRDRYAKIFNDASHNVIMIISGHEHNYQRICKTDKTGNIQFPVYIISGGGGAELSGQGECDISQIPLDGFRCLGLITAYQFMDVVADTDDKNNLVLKCKVLGLRYDLTRELPDDDTFEKQFVKERLALIDEFTLHWQKGDNSPRKYTD